MSIWFYGSTVGHIDVVAVRRDRLVAFTNERILNRETYFSERANKRVSGPERFKQFFTRPPVKQLAISKRSGRNNNVTSLETTLRQKRELLVKIVSN